MLELAALPLATLLAAVVTGFVRARALQIGSLDVPNERSSHVTPTPRGGGLAIVLVVLLGTILACAVDAVRSANALALVAGGIMVAAVGYWDDRRGLPPLPRFSVHLLASVLVVLAVAPLGTVQAGLATWAVLAVYVIGTAWSINSFNFMDGIDGIAASQAIFVTGVSAGWVFLHGDAGLATMLLVSSCACLGFLLWNWPPAKIFMGDVGSGFLGFWLAAVALLLHAKGVLSLFTSIILSSAFLADATVTLLRRMVAGRRWYEAHRSHAYQKLARKWGSHAKVVWLLWGLNILVLAPLAWAAEFRPAAAPFIAVAALAAVGALAVIAGAGKDEGAS
jgi:Fuc2NAc and GlcNAc transferase